MGLINKITENSNIELTEGVNDVAEITTFLEYEESQFGQHQLKIELNINGAKSIQWYPLRDKRAEETDEKYASAVNNWALTVRSLIDAFYPSEGEELEAVRTKVEEIITSLNAPSDLQAAAPRLQALLPEDYKTRDAQVILYRAKATDTYLSIPKFAFLAGGRFFAAHPSRLPLEVSDAMKVTMAKAKKEDNNNSSTPPPVSKVGW